MTHKFAIVTPKLWAFPLEIQWSGRVLYIQILCFQFGFETEYRRNR